MTLEKVKSVILLLCYLVFVVLTLVGLISTGLPTVHHLCQPWARLSDEIWVGSGQGAFLTPRVGYFRDQEHY